LSFDQLSAQSRAKARKNETRCGWQAQSRKLNKIILMIFFLHLQAAENMITGGQKLSDSPAHRLDLPWNGSAVQLIGLPKRFTDSHFFIDEPSR
jgi:hypothetical protein